MKPTGVNVLGKHYKITYCDKPSDVDIYKRDSLWGQVDYWTRTIRVYDNGTEDGDIFHVILHEVLHAITQELKITQITKDTANEEIIDLLSLGLADVLKRNDWIKEDAK